MKIRSNTKVNGLSMDHSYQIINLVVEWCKNNLSDPAIKRRKPLLVMVHRSSVREAYGEYCERNNWLAINLGVCDVVRDIVSTTIHEYCHFCQDLKPYCSIMKEVGYDNHPQELEAREYEKKYTETCWKNIRGLLN